MNLKNKIFLSLLLFVFVFSANAQRPNIVFIMIDDCSAVELSAYATKNHPAGNHTPVFDKLAEEGLLFETCWSTPLCMPTRSLLMSGKYGSKTGVYGNRLNRPDKDFAIVNKPVSKVLQDNGYETIISGKWHLPGFAAEEAWGWDSYSLLGCYMHPYQKDIVFDGFWFSWDDARRTFRDTAVIGKNHNRYPAPYWYGAVVENGKLLPYGPNIYSPDQNQQFVLDFIGQPHEKPFFLYYPMVLPHDPWKPTPDPAHPGERTPPGFSNLLKYAEFYVDQVITSLKENGLYENTWIVLTGDNATLRNGKGACSELGTRVPLIVAGGPLKHKGRTGALVDFSDFYPTLLDMAEIAPSKDAELDGQSLFPLLNNESYSEKPYIFSYLDNERTIRNKEFLMDGSGGIWRCSPDGNILEYQLMPEDRKTQEIRSQFLKIMEKYPLPDPIVFGAERMAKASYNYPWPSAHPSMVNALKNQDEWMNNPRRKEE